MAKFHRSFLLHNKNLPLICSVYVKPKKHLGQHFLSNDGICTEIAQSLICDDQYETVLEIGAGTGALTRHLLHLAGKKLFVSEIDHESIAYLNFHFPELKGRIIETDFLQLPLDKLFSGQVAIIGNFPYNISSQILFRILDYKDRVPEVVGMFQKEVAVRIASGPGNRDYGILSIFIQAYYHVEYLFTVDEKEFIPPPKIKSGVIRLVRKTDTSLGCDEKLFRQLVKTAFNQRRKTMRNSLKGFHTGRVDLSEPLFEKRPEQLSSLDFVALTKRYEEAAGNSASA
ncbi:MAG: 16S rRNA (adenine(1518)-N(6)/adenine(1519)-N(6))-dimethyltransferase RsmA [Crocinitomicaceae bacterium]|nr:16S rRNA (adenine(1518)-N(6)/adenine(1519)-N(6))-dimethyltransferase RsmA [Crocinitomicaceae bacterium]